MERPPNPSVKRKYRKGEYEDIPDTPVKVAKTSGHSSLSTKQDLERYFGKPLDEEANSFIDAAKRDVTIIPDYVEEASMDVVDEAMDHPGDFLEPEKILAKLIRKRKHPQVYTVDEDEDSL